MTPKEAHDQQAMLARVRARLKPIESEGSSVVDELIAERREAARREDLESNI